MSPYRTGDEIEPGRHAHPADQAEAILWAADVRSRALMLTSNAEAARNASALWSEAECLQWASGWIGAACDALRLVASGA